MGSCVGLTRYLLFIFNFALWLLGCALLSVGVWMKMDESAKHHVQRMTDHVDEHYQINYSATGDEDLTVTISYLLIVFGLILIVVTFIGCCGAVRENTCLLGVFALCLFAMLIALFVVGIWASVKKSDVDAHTEQLRKTTDGNIERAIQMYYSDQASSEFMDNIQARFKCCGAKNAENDYLSNKIPSSCLIEHYGRRCTPRYFKFVGDEIEDFLTHRYTIIAAVALSVAACVAIGLAVTLILCCLIRRTTTVRVS